MLITLSVIKLVLIQPLNKSDIQNISLILSTDLDQVKRGIINFLLMDGLLGILCGLYLLLL